MNVLTRCAVFAGIPSRDLSVLAEMMTTERLSADEELFEKGDPSDSVFVVADGRLGIFVDPRGRPVRILDAGELLGEYGMFIGLTRTATVRADTAAVLLSLDYQRFRAFLLQFPQSALVLLKIAVQRLIVAESTRR
jgi:CRP-like cAMP-binding protein